MIGSARRRRCWLALGWIATILLALAAWRAGPDGRDRSALAQSFGRFHPALVHLPIAFMLLVPLLDLAGRAESRAYLRKAAGFVLGITAASALFVALDGWVLARTGGYQGSLVLRHMWGGVAFSALCMAAASLRPAASPSPDATPAGRKPGAAYALALVAALVVLAWASHQGGTLTHGEGYLTAKLPPRFRAWLHLAGPPTVHPKPTSPGLSDTVWAKQIEPIFQRSCVSCHGPSKVKGDLRLDTYAGLMAGGEDGDMIAPWDPSNSELVRRITLPQDDTDFMPSNGKNILTHAEVSLIESWIAAGASDRQPNETLRPAAMAE